MAARAVAALLGAMLWSGAVAAAQSPPATPAPSPSPTATPFTSGGYLRSYYFTRQNASNNAGARFSPNPTYTSTGVNQASWNSAISLRADYAFSGGGWDLGARYLYANPMDGPCAVASAHAKNATYPSPSCVKQVPPNTNPDDTLPGFSLSTLYEAYLRYHAHGFAGEIGNQLFNSPWANAADSRLKPAAFQGADLEYAAANWTFEAADMLTFENRTSSDFSRQTLLTSYPAGASGAPQNIAVPGGAGINTNGFTYGKVGYSGPGGLLLDGYFYSVSDLVNMWWFDGKHALGPSSWNAFVALQGGVESNSGASYVGRVESQVIGAELGVRVRSNLLLAVGYDAIPWRHDTIDLPQGVTCSNSTYRISTKDGGSLAYFLPTNAAQCSTTKQGPTTIYFGGWASPYTDGYSGGAPGAWASPYTGNYARDPNTENGFGGDPLFTTSTTQGMADRRAPGTSWKLTAIYTPCDKRCTFIASDAWYDYGNALAPENTNIWILDGRYRFNRVSGPYKGLMLRYRYIQRTQSNTPTLGGLPLFKYNRAQLEYDF